MRHLRICLISRVRLFLFAALFFGSLHSQANLALAVESSELIRASIIEKIARFITWPEWELNQFNLCVFHKAPLLPALQSYYANEALSNKPVNLLVFDRINNINECQIVYVNAELKEQLASILEMVHKHPVLIIVEKKDAVVQGAHIDFFIDDNKINLEVNRAALNSSGLSASYHLLKVAHLVDSN